MKNGIIRGIKLAWGAKNYQLHIQGKNNLCKGEQDAFLIMLVDSSTNGGQIVWGRALFMNDGTAPVGKDVPSLKMTYNPAGSIVLSGSFYAKSNTDLVSVLNPLEINSSILGTIGKNSDRLQQSGWFGFTMHINRLDARIAKEYKSLLQCNDSLLANKLVGCEQFQMASTGFSSSQGTGIRFQVIAGSNRMLKIKTSSAKWKFFCNGNRDKDCHVNQWINANGFSEEQNAVAGVKLVHGVEDATGTRFLGLYAKVSEPNVLYFRVDDGDKPTPSDDITSGALAFGGRIPGTENHDTQTFFCLESKAGGLFGPGGKQKRDLQGGGATISSVWRCSTSTVYAGSKGRGEISTIPPGP